MLFGLAFGYFGCVKPMNDEVRAMRLSMSCLQNRVAKLVREADTAGEGAGLLVRLGEQRAAAAEATAALEEIEALNRRLAGQTRQIALLANAEDLATQTQHRISEHQQLLGAAEKALRDASAMQRRLASAERQITQAASAAGRMRDLCSQMVASQSMIDQAHAAGEDMAVVQERLILAARRTPDAGRAIDGFTQLSERLAATEADTPAALERVAQLQSLQSQLVATQDRAGEAAEALEVLSDLRDDLINAEGQFKNLREVVLEVVLMRPAVDRAVATLGPIRQLASLRHLDAKQLQVAAKALGAGEGETLSK